MSKWPLKKLGEHIIESKKRYGSEKLNGIQVLSVTNDQGFINSEKRTSENVGNYKIIKSGFFAYNPYRINVGSLAFAGSDYAGIVSPAYVVFHCANDLDPEYLWKYLKSDIGLFHIQQGGKGSVRSSLSFERLQEIEISLPPLPEQKRLVKKIMEIEEKVRALQKVNTTRLAEVRNIIDSWLNNKFSQTSKRNIDEKQDIIFATRGKSPEYSDNSVFICLNQKCNRWNEIDISHTKKVSKKWFEKIPKEMLTKEDDVIINSTGDGTVGRASLISKEYEGLIYDSHMLLIRFNKKIINPLFFVKLFNSRFGQQQVEDNISAKTTKQTELGLNNFMKTEIPNISVEEQNSIFEFLDQLNLKTKKAEDLIGGVKNYSNALMPSILSRAFNGEL